MRTAAGERIATPACALARNDGGRRIAAPAKEGLYLVRFEGRAEPLRLRWRAGRGFYFPRSGGEVVGNVTGWREAVE